MELKISNVHLELLRKVIWVVQEPSKVFVDVLRLDLLEVGDHARIEYLLEEATMRSPPFAILHERWMQYMRSAERLAAG